MIARMLVVALFAASLQAWAEDEPPAPAVQQKPHTYFDGRVAVSVGAGTFVDCFPASSVPVPGSSRGQFSLFGGVQFLLGVKIPPIALRVSVIGEIGYASSGYLPSRAADGLGEGIGLEVVYERWRVRPFVRAMYDAVVLNFRENAEGKLSTNAGFIAAGAQFSFLEAHLMLGKDLSGGVSPGFGLGVALVY